MIFDLSSINNLLPFQSLALCTLAAASGDSLGRQLSRILDALLNAAEKNDQYETVSSYWLNDSIERIWYNRLAIVDDWPVRGGYSLCDGWRRNRDHPRLSIREGKRRKCTFCRSVDVYLSPEKWSFSVLLHTFIEKTTANLEEFTDQIISGCIHLSVSPSPSSPSDSPPPFRYTTSHEQIADHVILGLTAFSKKMDPNQHMEVIPLARKVRREEGRGNREKDSFRWWAIWPSIREDSRYSDSPIQSHSMHSSLSSEKEFSRVR